MNIELDKKLFKKFSKLYRGRNLSIKENLMSFGFECGDGWYTLLEKLSQDIMVYCKKKKYPVPIVVQVKEKFGGLRFYTDGCDENIAEMIELAEEKSYKICENCGAEDKVSTKTLKGGFWIQSLCSACRTMFEKAKEFKK